MKHQDFNSKVLPTLVSSIFYPNDIFDEEAYSYIRSYGFNKLMQKGSINELENYVTITDVDMSPKSYRRDELTELAMIANPTNFKWFCNAADISINHEFSILNPGICAIVHIEATLIADLLSADEDLQDKVFVAIKNLVHLGLDCNQIFSDNFTIFNFLVSGNWSDSHIINSRVRLLLDLGADPNLCSYNGMSALMLIHDAEVANYLLQQPEYKPKYKSVGNTVCLDKKDFSNEGIYNYCLKNGGVDAAISRIEQQLLMKSTTPSKTKKVIKL
jgi:hypothetical protein